MYETLGKGSKFRSEISLGNTVVRLKATPCSRGGGPSEKKLLHGKFLSFLSNPFFPSSPPAPFPCFLLPRARDLLSGMPISATRGVTYPRSSPRVSFFSPVLGDEDENDDVAMSLSVVCLEKPLLREHTGMGYVSGEQDRLL